MRARLRGRPESQRPARRPPGAARAADPAHRALRFGGISPVRANPRRRVLRERPKVITLDQAWILVGVTMRGTA